jgi:hypothetical protein
MLMGYAAHPGDFPSTSTGAVFLALKGYKTARDEQIQARSALRLATEQKIASLGSLSEIMRSCLKKSTVDVADDPQKLAYIGWGPTAALQPAAPPEAPGNLASLAEGPASLTLEWQSPAGGGPVRNYIIERRQQAESGQFAPWVIVGSFLDSRAELTSQPRAIQLEYRVKAVNTGGQSPPSNTAAVVL